MVKLGESDKLEDKNMFKEVTKLYQYKEAVMKNILIQNIGAFIFIVVGICLLVGDVKFYIDMSRGNYEEISATVVDYKKHTRTRRSKHGSRRKTTTYSKIYEYEEDGEIKRYESSQSSNIDLGNVGDKAVLYRNIKTHRVREKPFKIKMMMGILFIGVGIFNMYTTYRKKSRQAYNSD